MTPYIRFCSRQLHAAQLLQRRVETDADARQFISVSHNVLSIKKKVSLFSVVEYDATLLIITGRKSCLFINC